MQRKGKQMKSLYIGGLVFDGRAEPKEGLGVVVEDGKIARIAPAVEFSGFSGMRIDTSGCTLMPGLIDCHVHLVLPGEPSVMASVRSHSVQDTVMRGLELAQSTLRGGFTAVRDLGGRDYIEISIRETINAGYQLGPTIHCAGKVICMTGGHGWFLGREADGPLDVVKAVRENIKAGADHIKFIATGGVATPNVDPMLAQLHAQNPAMLTDAFESVKRFSPTLARDRLGTRNLLRHVAMSGGELDHSTMKMLAETEKFMTESKRRS